MDHPARGHVHALARRRQRDRPRHQPRTLGQVEFAVLDAVNRGGLRSRRSARRVRLLRGQPTGETILHDVLHRCERNGLLHGTRDPSGRRYELTAAGRARLRADRRSGRLCSGCLLEAAESDSDYGPAVRARLEASHPDPGEQRAVSQPDREFGSFLQEHARELVADLLWAGTAVGEQRRSGAVELWRGSREEDVLGPRALMAERLRGRSGELEQPLGLRRDSERSGAPRRSASEPLNDALPRALGCDPQTCEHLGRELLGLGEQPEDQVLGPNVVVAELARLRCCASQHVGGGPGQPERRLPCRRVRERGEPLLGGLLAGASAQPISLQLAPRARAASTN